MYARVCVLLTRTHVQYKEGKAVLEKARMTREEWTSVSEYCAPHPSPSVPPPC